MGFKFSVRWGALALLMATIVTTLGVGTGPVSAAFPGKPGKIAYTALVDAQYEIFSVNPDGSEVSRLTTWSKADEDPAWSPDGERIAFARADAHFDVWVMNADGTGAVNLTPGAYDGQGTAGRNPTWSPDGTKIAFGNPNGEIWTVTPDGSSRQNLTQTPVAEGTESDPTYSPEGDKIAYINGNDLWVMNADGSNKQALSTDSEAERAPDWSPDGSEIVFQRGGEIWTIRPDGSDARALITAAEGGGTHPAWSPDGTQIVFSSSGFGAQNGPDLIVMNADGSSPKRLTGIAGKTDFQPSWQAIVDEVDLHVELTDDPDPVASESNVTYTATVTNESDVAARFVTLYSLVPTRSAYVSATPSQGLCRKTSTSITCSLGKLEEGASATLSVVVRTTSGFDLSYTVQASSSQGDPDPSDNSATETTTVEVAEGSDPNQDPLPQLTWSVPDRLRDVDGDGIVDEERFNNPKGAVVPFQMVLDACDSTTSTGQISEYHFEVIVAEGRVLEQVSPECRFSFEPPKEGSYPVTLTVTTTDGRSESMQQNVPFKDLFIVSLGDSVASGEGNPDKICAEGCHVWDEPESWQDRRCHRSSISGPSRAAQAIEASDSTSSVTFVHLACSGATVKNGIAGSYRGIEPPDDTSVIPPQAQVLKQLMDAWGRKPDAVLVSIGANDAHFADAVTKCLGTGRCFKDDEFVKQVKNRLATLPAAYDRLDKTLDGLQIPGNKVFLTEYFNPTRNEDGEFDDCMAPLLVPSEWQWAERNVIEPLNEHVRKGVNDTGHGWNLVGGIADAYRTHGMCSTDWWVVQIPESIDWQGDHNGSFHPNVPGHVLYGRRIVDVVKPKLGQ